MEEYIENRTIDPESDWDVSVRTEAILRLYPEYFNENKPHYEWGDDDNLVAYIQFAKFPEIIFRMLIIDYQDFIIMGEEEIVGYYSISNPKPGSNILAPKNLKKTKKQTDTDTNEEQDTNDEEIKLDEESDIQLPIYSTPKIIWSKGIVLHQNIEDGWAQAEVSKTDKNRVKVRVRGVKRAKMTLLAEILNWFELKGKDYKSIKAIECTCTKCRKADSLPYEIAYHHFQNLQKIFIPQIQCYASGELLRLDEISSVEQPEVRLAVLYAEEDLPFFENFYEFFKKQGDFKIELWEPRDLLAKPRPLEEILSVINRAHLVIFMMSVDFDNSPVIRQGIDRAIQLFKTKDILIKVIQLKSFDWQDHPLFKNSRVLSINPEPIELANNRAEAWRQVAKQLHREIEEWVKDLGKAGML